MLHIVDASFGDAAVVHQVALAARPAGLVQAPKTVLSEPATGGAAGLRLLDGGLGVSQ